MRGFFNKLSGTHLTIMAVAALLGPGTLGAAVVYQAVAITDPNTGAKAYVDRGRNLHVVDPIAAYANNPANFVSVTTSGSTTELNKTIYTVPAGKALVIRSIQLSYYGNSGSSNNFIRFTQAVGGLFKKHLMDFDFADKAGTKSIVLEPGLVLRSGEDLIAKVDSRVPGPGGGIPYTAFILLTQGYLVPSTAISAAGAALAQEP